MSEFYPFAHIINIIAVDIKGLTLIVDWCELTWVFLMQFSDVCTLVPVSYTHLDVYKRQGQSLHLSMTLSRYLIWDLGNQERPYLRHRHL